LVQSIFARGDSVVVVMVMLPLSFRHSGAMRSIEPGISRFRVWC
jgi:hypothetical protein